MIVRNTVYLGSVLHADDPSRAVSEAILTHRPSSVCSLTHPSVTARSSADTLFLFCFVFTTPQPENDSRLANEHCKFFLQDQITGTRIFFFFLKGRCHPTFKTRVHCDHVIKCRCAVDRISANIEEKKSSCQRF